MFLDNKCFLMAEDYFIVRMHCNSFNQPPLLLSSVCLCHGEQHYDEAILCLHGMQLIPVFCLT